jgi:hypothetical protein
MCETTLIDFIDMIHFCTCCFLQLVKYNLYIHSHSCAHARAHTITGTDTQRVLCYSTMQMVYEREMDWDFTRNIADFVRAMLQVPAYN